MDDPVVLAKILRWRIPDEGYGISGCGCCLGSGPKRRYGTGTEIRVELMKIAAYMDAGRWYTQTFQNGDMIYFTPTAPQKNGGWKGLQVDLYVDSGRPRKAKQISVARSNFGLWKEIPERDVPKNVMAKFKVRMASEQDFWMDQADVAEVCPDCALKMATLNVRRIRASVLFGADDPELIIEAARNRTAAKGDKWKKMPKGWTDESRKKFWETLTGDRKKKVTACIKKMEGKVDDPGAFCASLADRVEGKEWRKDR